MSNNNILTFVAILAPALLEAGPVKPCPDFLNHCRDQVGAVNQGFYSLLHHYTLANIVIEDASDTFHEVSTSRVHRSYDSLYGTAAAVDADGATGKIRAKAQTKEFAKLPGTAGGSLVSFFARMLLNVVLDAPTSGKVRIDIKLTGSSSNAEQFQITWGAGASGVEHSDTRDLTLGIPRYLGDSIVVEPGLHRFGLFVEVSGVARDGGNIDFMNTVEARVLVPRDFTVYSADGVAPFEYTEATVPEPGMTVPLAGALAVLAWAARSRTNNRG